MNPGPWVIAPPRPEADILAAELGIPLPIARVLTNRNILSAKAAETFLNGTLKDLNDPYLMKGMDRAVSRIEEAIKNKEKILIFGDYDVDGVLSVVILLRALAGLGAEVDYFIPERLREGYGIKEAHIRIAKERGARLVVSVDCGIKAVDFTAKAREAGVDVIITDHHRPGDTLPEAVALLNPVLKESGYPYPSLAGVGVVFKLLQALLEKRGKSAQLPHYAKLVAIGTIADVADLRGENRLLVKLGLKGLEKVSNRGLRSLLDQCGLLDRKISEGDVGFRIAPRINAAGRMGAAGDAVRLFFSDDAGESLRLARRLSEMNSQRQNEEDKIYSEALSRIREGSLDRRYRMLVLGCETWHRGIIGIVASKLKDFFYRPVLLFSYEDGKAHGSGRSISELSLIECLDACRDIFHDYGGHTLAVGCVLPRERMGQLKERINQVVGAMLKDDDLLKKVRIDARLNLAEIEPSFIDSYLRLAPFGVGNPKPTFLSEGVEVVGPPQVLQDKHLKFLARQDGRMIEVLGWDRKEWLGEVRKAGRLDLVYSLRASTFLGEEQYSLSLEAIKAAEK
ncbi:MAG: single-stranded-DNA-specific exonuclease RecJ [Candidatus Aminicenantes bacterium RBG_19FT_COMBO_58_17]|jgi:single-stranded-DNA-specific exonuclease|nr:MAG: single-stranded-DNA-specific exonuclease RecJ [Candidatus Aminicenantes bacterium RBG_19FT_COMBO_58_17]